MTSSINSQALRLQGNAPIAITQSFAAWVAELKLVQIPADDPTIARRDIARCRITDTIGALIAGET